MMMSCVQACRGYEISHPYPHPYPQIFFVDIHGNIHGYIHGYTHGLPIACLWLTCKIATRIPQSATGGRAIGGATPKFLGGPNPSFHLFPLLSPLLFLFLPSSPSLPFRSVPLVVALVNTVRRSPSGDSAPPTGSAAEPQQKANLCILLALKSDVWWHQFY